jgi:deferrochelatase/peroxidase EfeB
MSQQTDDEEKLRASRRGFLAGAAGLTAVAGTGLGIAAARSALGAQMPGPDSVRTHRAEPYWGPHQGGIVTPQQRHTYFAVFDLVTDDRREVVKLMQAWTEAAARMCAGHTAQPMDGMLTPIAASPSTAPSAEADAYGAAPAAGTDAYGAAPPLPPGPQSPGSGAAADTGEVLGMSPAQLTITFGFGAGLFLKDGKDRYGLASRHPAALVDLPKFPGDELVASHTGGDLSVQACADDPQITFHAVRQLARIAGAAARIRWVQTGFLPDSGKETPRNLMGFKDGTVNPPLHEHKALNQFVWAGEDSVPWMCGGSYMVARRIRMALEHWDRVTVAFQEQTFGRNKLSGAPLGKRHEFDALDLNATDKDGNPVIPENAHVRLAAAATNGGAQILRRGYSYDNGFNFVAERWPPWHAGMEYDSGLLFICYQSDPRTGFIKLYERLSRFDMMNQFVTHIGSGVFACPGGASESEYIGQRLFESA